MSCIIEDVTLSRGELEEVYNHYRSGSHGCMTRKDLVRLLVDLVRIIFKDNRKKCRQMEAWVEDPLFGLDDIMVLIDCSSLFSFYYL